MSEEIRNIQNAMYNLPKNTRTQLAMEELISCVNVMGGEEEVGEVMAAVLQNSHRTLQQSFFTALQAMCEEYQNTGTDMRNAAAVEMAKKIVALEHHLPFV